MDSRLRRRAYVIGRTRAGGARFYSRVALVVVSLREVVREVGLLAVLLMVVVAGSFGAQRRQILMAAPLDAVGVVLLVGAVVVAPGRRWWPRSVFAAVAVIIAGYLLLGYTYGPIVVAASVAVFALVSVESTGVGVIAVVGALGLWVSSTRAAPATPRAPPVR